MIRTSQAIALAVAIGSAVPATAQDVVNFGVQPSTQPILIAHGAGYLREIEEKHKIKILLRSFSYGAPENQALAAGELQIASAGMGSRGRSPAGHSGGDRYPRPNSDPSAERLQDQQRKRA